jgi:ubiquinone/menaquinone biosynthesis C-methylase UbiE
MQVVDIASGRTGHFAFRAGEIVGDRGQVYAIDVLPSVVAMLHGARSLRGALNVRPLWGDAERAGGVPLADGSIDLALLVHTLSALRDWEALAIEARRLIKPKGRLVVVDWHPTAAHPVAAQSSIGHRVVLADRRPSPAAGDVLRAGRRRGCGLDRPGRQRCRGLDE